MARATTLSPSVGSANQHQDLSDKLDADIARVRSEIDSLTKRKRLLTASLVSSTRFQSALSMRTSSIDEASLDMRPLLAQAQHNETNIHRLAYGVTSFPFTDPNPDTSDRPLLGIRFDIPSRSGRFEKAPYYVFLKRVHDDNVGGDARTTGNEDDLKIHHHTIPELIPLKDYEARFLPQTGFIASGGRRTRDEGYFSPSSPRSEGEPVRTHTHDRNEATSNNSTQNLHALVSAVRRDLTSWHLRDDAISILAEQLNVSPSDDPGVGKYSLMSLQATALEARFCRLVWRNGTVGRLRLTDDGFIDRAVVIGEVGDERKVDRVSDIERTLCTGMNGSKLRIEDLAERLKQVASKMKVIIDELSSREDDDDMDMDDSNTHNASQ